jgi:hypothetical protein
MRFASVEGVMAAMPRVETVTPTQSVAVVAAATTNGSARFSSPEVPATDVFTVWVATTAAASTTASALEFTNSATLATAATGAVTESVIMSLRARSAALLGTGRTVVTTRSASAKPSARPSGAARAELFTRRSMALLLLE